MAKVNTPGGKKIELPTNVNYLDLVDKSIESVLSDLEGNKLSSAEENSLRQVASHHALKQLLANSLEIAAKDGLYTNEVTEILGDTNDLIQKASKEKKFKDLISNPAAAQFKLSLPTIVAIKNLTQEEQDILWKSLSVLHPDLGQHMLDAFESLGKALLPGFKAVCAKLLEIGAGLLASTVHEKVGGQTGDVLTEGILDITKALKDTVLDDANPAHTEEKTVAGDVVEHAHTVHV